MRITITVSTPKHAYIWKHVIDKLQREEVEVQVLLRDYGETLEVAHGIGLEGEVFGRCRGKGYRRLAETPVHLVNHLRKSWKFKPRLVAGTGVFEANTAKFLGIPAIAITDTEEAPLQNKLTRHLADRVLVPECFQTNPFGDKKRTIPGYLELAYLHPDHYQPDSTVLDDLGVEEAGSYALLRFNAMDSVHDRGAKGFSTQERIELVERLLQHGDVFISSEGWLPKELEQYQFSIDAHRIHDALYYAGLYVGDSGTMQNEAAVLGTPSIRYSHLPRDRDRGNTLDLSERYGLVSNIRSSRKAIDEAERFFASGKTTHRKSRQVMLKEKVNVAELLSSYLLNYPESDRILQSQGTLGTTTVSG